MDRLTYASKRIGEAGLLECLRDSCADICNKQNHCHDCPIQKAFNKLAYYEDLEENALIGDWPGISIGSHVWRVIFGYYPDIDDQIKEYIVSGISVYENETIGDNMILLRDIDDDSYISFGLDSWNISIFDTFEKAEKCLKSEEKRRKYE